MTVIYNISNSILHNAQLIKVTTFAHQFMESGKEVHEAIAEAASRLGAVLAREEFNMLVTRLCPASSPCEGLAA